MNTCFRILHYCNYILHAKDEFSLHSPFMFTLFTNSVKRKKGQKGLKKQQIICQIKSFLSSYNIITHSCQDDYNQICNEIKKRFTVIIIEDIHSSKENFDLWHRLILSNKDFITADFYSFGLLINNPDVKKSQNYILRTK